MGAVDTADFAVTALRLEPSIREDRVRESLLAQDLVLAAMAQLAETRDAETGNHILRTQGYVLALGRESYDRAVDRHDTVTLLRDRALWRLGLRYWRTGLSELWRARSRSTVLADLRRLVPELDGSSLRPARPGIRAQAISADGRLVDDFAFATSPRCVHVLNAPSPAATASLAIGEQVAERAARLLEAP